MRAALLFILGGVLLWFVWHSVSGGGRVPTDVQAVSPGAMLAPESAEATGAMASTEKVDTAHSTPPPAPGAIDEAHPADDAPIAAKQIQPAPTPPTPEIVGATATPPESKAVQANSGPVVELELARAWLSDPKHFEAALQARTDLATPRKALARALARGVDGDLSAAKQASVELADEPSIHTAEREFLKGLADPDRSSPIAAAADRESPLVLAASLLVEAQNAEKLLEKGHSREAAASYSHLLLEALETPWHTDAPALRRWTDALLAAQKRYRWARDGAWPSVSTRVEPGDSWITVRKRILKEHPDLLLCTGQLERANEMQAAVLQPGQVLRAPTDHAHMLVDLDSHWALYMLGDEVVSAWEVGVGKDSTQTKVGSFTVGDKKEEPMWFRPGKQPVPYGDPENPLGTRWIAWMRADGSSSGLGFHGTNDPTSVGKEQSQGCIRMLNQDVEELFEILPRGAKILVRP